VNLLLITYVFPPMGGPGAQRPLQTARVLAELGWDVTVLTVADPPTSLRDDSALESLPASVRVERAWSLEPTRALQWLRRGRQADGGEGSSAGYSGAPSGFIRLVQACFMPDEKVGWTPWAVRAARRLHSERPFDVVLASGPPFTAFRVASKVSRRLRVPWVADVRDPLVGNYFFAPATPLHARYLRGFERAVALGAARTVAATHEIAADIATRNPEVARRITTITNGFDPADFPGTREGRDPEHFTISYVGSFQGPIRPDTFLGGIERARAVDPQLARDLRVRFVGPKPSGLSGGAASLVEATGYVPHGEAVREMEAADVLLLVLGDLPHLRGVLTGKLPEYLGARRPVLALVPEGAARDALERTGAAQIVAPDDPEGVAQAVLRLHRAWKDGSLPEPDPAVVGEFDRMQLVKRLSELLREVASGD